MVQIEGATGSIAGRFREIEGNPGQETEARNAMAAPAGPALHKK